MRECVVYGRRLIAIKLHVEVYCAKGIQGPEYLEKKGLLGLTRNLARSLFEDGDISGVYMEMVPDTEQTTEADTDN